jgi:condensin complex subunit 1
MEPWTYIVFSKMSDSEDIIRRNTLNMISDLIVKGLVKPRGRMADVAMLLLDENERIKQDAKTFFLEFSEWVEKFKFR